MGGEAEPIEPSVQAPAPRRKLHWSPSAIAVAASRPSIFLGSIEVVLTPSIQSEPIAHAWSTEVDSGIVTSVEAQRLAPGFAYADQRGRLIVERETVGGLKGETEFWMNERGVVHRALGWVVAESEAVDGGEIGVASGFAGPRRPELPRLFGRLSDALWRRGMGRHHVRAIVRASARDRSAKRAPLAERGEESSRAVGDIISRVGDRS